MALFIVFIVLALVVIVIFSIIFVYFEYKDPPKFTKYASDSPKTLTWSSLRMLNH